MRLSILPVLLAGAGIVSQVTAEPLRVLVESPSNANANIRFGHALANANVNGNDDSDNVARLVRPSLTITTSTEVKGKHHFCGASLKAKALRMSNAFRHALGLPLIETGDHDGFKSEVISKSGPGVHILPMPLFGTPITPKVPASSSEEENSGDVKELLPDGSVVRIYRHHEGESHHRHHEAGSHHHSHHDMKHKKAGSFLRRVHRAIMALSLWEGRAVAFVLGCGIGVLLRMFWVMSVLVYRTVRGERPEEVGHGFIMFEHDAENNFVPPPEYTDEKVKVAEVEAQEIETLAK
ncbi:hypothetical protein DEU56DRAFT_806781 [Suillus clintonianus]|uniref:uncharacterized protein n=1 Tax=Suillus clintonianus TaxID=1904413 RepID=UPI001B8648B0|nr:uncharacterized protein DEU56DRAFT_806781 [Suillus clintonianus]KAG2135851.1 hypothetical protein DEU56DRAFT_806781 [Suillus clintonianus]